MFKFLIKTSKEKERNQNKINKNLIVYVCSNGNISNNIIELFNYTIHTLLMLPLMQPKIFPFYLRSRSDHGVMVARRLIG